jgi:hypothetical protein
MGTSSVLDSLMSDDRPYRRLVLISCKSKIRAMRRAYENARKSGAFGL